MNAFLLYRIYGLKGLLLYFKLKFGRVKNIRLPDIQSIIHLRPGTSDREVFDQIFLDREYDLQIPFKPRVIVDCGANIGLTSVFFANKYPGAKIVCIEPEITNFKALVKNTSYYKNIAPIQAAVWNEPGKLQILDAGTGEWGFMVGHSRSDALESHQIETITLTNVIEDFRIPHIDILKIDIEGAEKELFTKNFETWLPKVKCIIIELHDNLKKGTSKTVFNALGQYNFSFSLERGSLVFINQDFDIDNNPGGYSKQRSTLKMPMGIF